MLFISNFKTLNSFRIIWTTFIMNQRKVLLNYSRMACTKTKKILDVFSKLQKLSINKILHSICQLVRICYRSYAHCILKTNVKYFDFKTKTKIKAIILLFITTEAYMILEKYKKYFHATTQLVQRYQ